LVLSFSYSKLLYAIWLSANKIADTIIFTSNAKISVFYRIMPWDYLKTSLESQKTKWRSQSIAQNPDFDLLFGGDIDDHFLFGMKFTKYVHLFNNLLIIVLQVQTSLCVCCRCTECSASFAIQLFVFRFVKHFRLLCSALFVAPLLF
jgi:hypothetical protein